MPTQFSAFVANNRDPNAVFYTPEVTVPDTADRMVRFTVKPAEFLIDEPDTTIVYWTIEIADGPGQEFRHSASGTWHGMNGVIPPRPHGYIAMSMPAPGSVIRGVMYFDVADGKRRRFGVDGETY